MSFEWMFKAGEFDPELTAVIDADETVRIMKVGGGTIGNSYDGAFLVEIESTATGGSVKDEFEYTTGMPKTHWDVLLEVIEFREED